MLCQFEKLVRPYNISDISPDTYMVALYIPCGILRDTSGNIIKQIKAVGYDLPLVATAKYELKGNWSRNQKYGIQYEVESYDEVVGPTREGIISYLSSGLIKGIGPKIAAKIYDVFGDMALEVLDKEPDKLLTISGISQSKLEKICDSYLENRGAKEMITFLAPYGVSTKQILYLHREYGREVLDTVKKNPYHLCELIGTEFSLADKIAMSMGISKISTDRTDAGLVYTLAEVEKEGHFCMEKRTFIEKCMKLLNTPSLTKDMLANRAARLVQNGKLVSFQGNVFRAQAAKVEEELAGYIVDMLSNRNEWECIDIDALLDQEEKLLKIRLAPEQREAVKKALTEGILVITGGPGTGKTMILKVILDICQYHCFLNVVCCAPTGRAARRMEESTGEMSSTVHKLLGLVADESNEQTAMNFLDADIILVDEVSMMDAYLAWNLFRALKKGSRIILIGDVDQLPSVGPGAVLRDIIASSCVPVVRLNKVFRQNAGSRIAINAQLIRHGNVRLEENEDFRIIESADLEESADILVKEYMQDVSEFGMDNVTVLTPFKHRTATSANALNERIQEAVNPAAFGKPEVKKGDITYRLGDKVMHIKNAGEYSNGDMGYVDRITKRTDGTMVNVDFGDGKSKEYERSDLDMLVLGYDSTIHKSQGGEYSSVLINLQSAHEIMLSRSLIYTAVTRGKKKVTIVGERSAICHAITHEEIYKRCTCLAFRIKKIYEKRVNQYG